MANKRPNEEVTNSDLALMIENLTNKLDASLSAQQNDRDHFNGKIAAAEVRLNIVEKEVNKKTLIVTGVEFAEGEDLTDIIVKISKCLGHQVSKNEVDDIWRIGKQKEKIKVTFLRAVVRRNLLKKVRERKQLSTTELSLSYDQQVYLNEELGKGAQQIWQQARKLKQQKIIAGVWTTEGRVFYKVKSEDDPKLCTSLFELQQLEGSTELAPARDKNSSKANPPRPKRAK